MRWIVGALLAAGSTVVAAPAAAAGWSPQTVPGVPGGTNVALSGVSCATGDACEAVGSFVTSDGKTVALAESWDGRVWSVQDVPLPSGVFGYRPSDVYAVLNAVSCARPTACMAVGGWSAGPHAAPFAERWDGHSWTVQDTGGSASDFEGPQFTGVSCPSPTRCQAVGYSNSPNGHFSIAARWNGSRWRLESVPEGPHTESNDFTEPILRGVSCASAAACAAAGGNDFGPLVEAWNGVRWAIRPTPKSTGALQGVSCRSGRSCVAVGVAADPAPSKPLAERWDGSRWSLLSPVRAGRHTASELSGISCARPSSWCIAVGSWNANRHGAPAHTLAELWDGHRWRVQATPSGSGRLFNAISCTADRTCIAVGSSSGSGLIERYLPRH